MKLSVKNITIIIFEVFNTLLTFLNLAHRNTVASSVLILLATNPGLVRNFFFFYLFYDFHVFNIALVSIF